MLLAEAEFRRGRWDVASAIAEQALGLIADTEQHWMAPWGPPWPRSSREPGRWEIAEAQLSLAAEESAASFGIEFTRGMPPTRRCTWPGAGVTPSGWWPRLAG